MDPLFLRAVRGETTERFPVWMMRQAGRYLPGYQALRAKTSFLDMCRAPDLAAEVTLEPVDLFDVDAAIVFADILLTCDAIGIEVDFPQGGPKILKPIRRPEDVQRIHEPDASRVEAVSKTVAILRKTLPDTKAVIGFSGAPFTLCAYMIEGGTSREFARTRRFAWEHPKAFHELLMRTADALVPYLKEQAEAGADVLQLFDTWGGLLHVSQFRLFALKSIRRVLEGLGPDRPPVILFPGLGAEARLEDAAEVGVEALSLDWRCSLKRAYARVGDRVRLQGNLDPTLLLTDEATIRSYTNAMLDGVPAGKTHLVNLGHGIIKETPPENAAAFVEAAQAFRPQAAGSTA